MTPVMRSFAPACYIGVANGAGLLWERRGSSPVTSFDLSTTVGDIVARHPGTSRVFDRAGVDFCCGGKRSLAEACQAKGIPAGVLMAELEGELAAVSEEPEVSLVAAPLPALARYIVERFHVPLREELPRLGRMVERVLEAHGRAHPDVVPELARVFRHLRAELEEHMAREEAILFPALEAMVSEAAGDTDRQVNRSPAPGASLAVLPAMEAEHEEAGAALRRIRELTRDFVPPIGACNTFRALYDGLARLESDMHLHVHLENSVLFPRALALERELGGSSSSRAPNA